MGVVRQLWENRSIRTLDLLKSGSKVPTIPTGYGQPGSGSWDSGMVWNSGSGFQSFGSTGYDVKSSLRLSAVFGCFRLLSEAISTLPIDLYLKEGKNRTEVPKPDYLVFELPGISKISYLSQIMLSLLSDGNAFIATPRNDFGVPVFLTVLDPKLVDVKKRGGVPYYVVNNFEYSMYDIVHIAGMTLPGELRGISPLAMAMDVVDGARKAQTYGSNFMENFAMPPGVIEMPDTPNEGSRQRAIDIARTWKETNGGPSNAGKVGVLLGGATLNTIAISPEEAQWLDSKKFTVPEIARFYGVPPHLIADASNSTSWGSGLAEQNNAFGQFSLRTWTERIDEAHKRLLQTHDSRNLRFKLNLDAMLRASTEDRFASYAIAISSGFMEVDEVRALEDLEPLNKGI